MADRRVNTRAVLEEVFQERERQDAKFGPDLGLPDGTGAAHHKELLEWVRQRMAQLEKRGRVTFVDVLVEEVAEARAESDPVRLRGELVQVAAVAVKWIEAIDQRGGRDG